MLKKNKKIVVIVPIKTKSKRVKNKNFKKICNVPLYKNNPSKIKKM